MIRNVNPGIMISIAIMNTIINILLSIRNHV
jgi:hypothetical protein